jgi:aspartate 1-decarboxylase
MLRTIMRAKIHRAHVTEANLNYVGSLTVDANLMQIAGLAVGEQVDVVDVTNGARLTTYVIEGEPNSGVICVNGAAAHHIFVGDIVIIICYNLVEETEISTVRPSVVFVDEHNQPIEETGPAERR